MNVDEDQASRSLGGRLVGAGDPGKCQVDVTRVPDGWQVLLDADSDEMSADEVAVHGDAHSGVELLVGKRVNGALARGLGRFHLKDETADGRTVPLKVKALKCRNIVVDSPAISLHGYEPPDDAARGPGAELVLLGTHVRPEGDISLPRVKASGELQAVGRSQLRIDDLIIDNQALTLSAERELDIGRLRWESTAGIVRLGGKVIVESCQDETAFRLLEEAELHLRSDRVERPAVGARLKFEGAAGAVWVDGELRAPNFARSDAPYFVALPKSVVTEASGAVRLARVQHATVLGSASDPLRIEALEVPAASNMGMGEAAFEHGELEYVDVEPLTISQVRLLELLDRFAPVPPSELSRTGSPSADRERAHKLQVLVRMAEAKGARGQQQSRLRWAQFEARRIATAPNERWERMLLWGYKGFGYGEKVWPSLLVYGIAAMLTLVGLRAEAMYRSLRYGTSEVQFGLEHLGSALLDLLRVLSAPLLFFRFEAPWIEPFRGHWLLLVYQVIGIASIVFALLAIRRVTRAE